MTSPDATARAFGSARPISVSDLHLRQLTAELDDHARIARYLGVDFQRAPRSMLATQTPLSPMSARLLNGCSSSCGSTTAPPAPQPERRCGT